MLSRWYIDSAIRPQILTATVLAVLLADLALSRAHLIYALGPPERG